ncbi:MAG: pantoate--beta-alanine ligase [Pedobacter agri]
MIVFKNADTLKKHLFHQKDLGHTIGFVPTMGALHAGHISLIKASQSENDVTICSIFVNPTQFNDPKDFEKYPITLEKDIESLVKHKTDILFIPSVQEIYPDGTKNLPRFDLGHLESVLEGPTRPGHFQGVCQVMSRLLEMVSADNLYMGQKDYQQCMVIKKLISLIGSETELHTCPTLREKDGLAMSSRNTRLNEESRKKAPALFETLNYLKQNIQPGSLQKLKEEGRRKMEQSGFKVDYVEIADANSLDIVDNYNGKQELVGLIAAFIQEIRLIDNMKL